MIRDAVLSDVNAILEIVNHEIKTSTVLYDYNERTLAFQQQWFLKKQADGLPVIVAEEEGKVLAFGTFGIFRPWDAYQYSVEHSIYVHKDARGKGVGKLLMAELIRLAKEMGFHTMIAGVDASNANSILFHEKFGFKEVGTFKEVGFKFNNWLDLTFMQLLIK